MGTHSKRPARQARIRLRSSDCRRDIFRRKKRDLDELKAAKEKLTNSAQALFTKMYENMQAAQQAGQAGPGPDMGGAGSASSSNDDDIIDGDFREV